MRPRIRHMSNLYHRWGRNLDLSAEEIAAVLEMNGLITLLDKNRYREVERTKITLNEYESLVNDLLTEFKANRG